MRRTRTTTPMVRVSSSRLGGALRMPRSRHRVPCIHPSARRTTPRARASGVVSFQEIGATTVTTAISATTSMRSGSEKIKRARRKTKTAPATRLQLRVARRPQLWVVRRPREPPQVRPLPARPPTCGVLPSAVESRRHELLSRGSLHRQIHTRSSSHRCCHPWFMRTRPLMLRPLTSTTCSTCIRMEPHNGHTSGLMIRGLSRGSSLKRQQTTSPQPLGFRVPGHSPWRGIRR
mmetsp:Transcript_122285/g.307559  ORF Transcript_122285/g.307559 Transcript_122285/m.307559 type:complete len:233 (+) Transcript_122285:179-877(+)